MKYLICYDIPNTKVRTKLSKYLESFAWRVQYSVFICEVQDKKLSNIKNNLRQIVASDEESSLFIYPICMTCNSKLWSIGRTLEEKLSYYVI